MKRNLKLFLRKTFCLLALIALSKFCAAQSHVTMSLTNCASTSNNTVEFDLYIVNDGTYQLKLGAIAFGVNYSSSILNNGTPGTAAFTFQAGSRDPALAVLNPYSMNHTLSKRQIKFTTSPIPHSIAPVLNINQQYKLGRFTFTNTVAWTNNSNPAFNLQMATQTGYTDCTPLVYVNGLVVSTALNVTGPLPAGTRSAVVSCSLILNPTPVITSISPTTINAGVGSVLTITGSGFGATRGSGNVYFKNADDGGTGAEIPLDNDDWIGQTWTNNQISFVLPSNVAAGVPGSGKVRVTNNFANTVQSANSVNINYAVSAIGISKKRARLARFLCDNGYTFYLGSGTTMPTAAQQSVIRAACDAWSNYLNIDIKLTTLTHSGSPAADTYSVIYIDNTITGFTMKTSRWKATCNNDLFWTDADIAINGSLNWHYGIGNDLPTGLYDFYAAILHEIGHALGLEHSIDLVNSGKELMHYMTPKGFLAAANRTTLFSGGGNSSAGVLLDIVTPSRLLNLTGCTGLQPLTTRQISSPSITPADPIVICTGSTVDLTSSAATSSTPGNTVANLWSPGGATGTTISVGGVTTTYTVTVTQNGDCPISASRLVTVAGTSTILSQPSNASACTGGTASFSCSSTGATFQWQRSINGGTWADVVNGTYYSGATTATLNILQAQTYGNVSQQYRCMVTQPTFCPTSTNAASLTVTTVAFAPLASVYTSSPAFTLTGGSPSGGTYSGTGVSGTTFTPPSSAANITITYTKTGCTPLSDKKVIQVVACGGTYPACVKKITTNDVPTSFCMGASPITFNVPLTVLGCPYNAGNVFTVQLSNSSGSFASPTVIGTLSGTGSGFPNCTGTISATIPVGIPIGTKYRIRVISSNPAVTGSANLNNITISNTPCNQQRLVGGDEEEIDGGSSRITTEDINVFPNPANDQITVTLPSGSNLRIIQLTDLRGRIVKEILIENLTEATFNISDLESGIYILVLSDQTQSLFKKVLVAK